VTIKEGSGVGKLLDLPSVGSADYCAAQGLDLLVWGMLKEVQGYLLLEVWAFDATRGTIVLSSREAANRDQIYAFMPTVGKDLAGIILGREWTRLAFNPDPPGASLYVDDVLVASGVSPSLYLSPGTKTIRVSARGYREETRTVTLEPGQQFPLDVKLDKRIEGSVTVTSEPSGADLYVDSIWKGKTPVSVELPPSRSRGVLSLTGFYDLPFSIGPDSLEQLSFPLQMDVGARDLLQKRARNEFYVSFGLFAVSIVLPLFSYALAIDSVVHENEFLLQGQTSQAASAHLNYQIYLGGYYAGMAVSAALFTWMIFRIVHYVSVSNGTAG
ncbi:MAG: PEGA domain-containing protein, partial [Spirochaetia bacterium]